MIGKVSFQGHIYTNKERLNKKIENSPEQTKKTLRNSIDEFAKTINDKTPDNSFFIFDFDPGIRFSDGKGFNASISTELLGNKPSKCTYLFNLHNQSNDDLKKIFNQYTETVVNKANEKDDSIKKIKSQNFSSYKDFLHYKISQCLADSTENIFYDKRKMIKVLSDIIDEDLRSDLIDNINRLIKQINSIVNKGSYYKINLDLYDEKDSYSVNKRAHLTVQEFKNNPLNKGLDDIENFSQDEFEQDFCLYDFPIDIEKTVVKPYISDKNQMWEVGFSPILDEILEKCN